MKIPRLPVVVWAACLAGCLASIFWLDSALPETVASHFGSGGHADGWSSRSAHTVSFAFLALFFSSLAAGIVYLVRFLPSDALNVTNAQYWRAPEHFREACEYLSGQAFWFGALSAVWFALFNYFIAEANRLSPPVLNYRAVIVVSASYVAATVAWIILALRHFRNPTTTAG